MGSLDRAGHGRAKKKIDQNFELARRSVMLKPIQIALMVALPLAASIGTVAEDAHAAGSCNSAAGTCTGLITGVVAHSDAGTGSPAITGEIKLEITTGPGCTTAGGWWEVGAGKENVLRVATAAYLAGKPITLRQTATSGTCFVAWAQM